MRKSTGVKARFLRQSAKSIIDLFSQKRKRKREILWNLAVMYSYYVSYVM